MKGPIPDMRNPSPLVLAIREKREAAAVAGRLLLLEMADLAEFAEIERQMG